MSKHTQKRKSFKLTKWFLSIAIGWRVVIALLSIIGAAAVVMFAIVSILEIHDEVAGNKYYVSEYMGSRYVVRKYNNGTKQIAERGKRRSLVKNVDWVIGYSSDSLWVVASRGRRAYFNVKTGQLLSPFIYRKAWLYSDGVAAVVDSNSRLRFIDPQGNLAFARSFEYNRKHTLDYVFKKGLCPIYDTMGHIGLIDKHGEWVVAPVYDSMAYVGTYWSLMRGDSLSVADSTGCTIIGMRPGQQLNITDEGDLEVWQNLRPACLYNKEGKIVAKQTYWNLSQLAYYENDKEIYTGLLVYQTCYQRSGLITSDGQVLTDAIYSDIEALGKNLFRAAYDCNYGTSYILLNDKGELVEK